jgi:hypothetical protein
VLGWIALASCTGAGAHSPETNAGVGRAVALASAQEVEPQDAGATRELPALDVLATLTIAPEHLGSPVYNRADWPLWRDLDGDGCDTRDAVLAEEATQPDADGGCDVPSASWTSPYDGRELDAPGDVDVDHLVALAEVHRSGGWAWDAAKRTSYANDLDDPRTLVAVSASANRSKGDRDPAGWLPERDVCTYVGDWIAVKARWGLSLDAEEATAISDLLVGPCTGTTIEPWPAAPAG